MFTGIVTDIGEVQSVSARTQSLSRFEIACGYDPASIALGASICCSGICLTVVEVEAKHLARPQSCHGCCKAASGDESPPHLEPTLPPCPEHHSKAK